MGKFSGNLRVGKLLNKVDENDSNTLGLGLEPIRT